MSKEQITTRLDGLAQQVSSDVDAGREPDPEQLDQYADALCDFIREEPVEALAWLREVYRGTA